MDRSYYMAQVWPNQDHNLTLSKLGYFCLVKLNFLAGKETSIYDANGAGKKIVVAYMRVIRLWIDNRIADLSGLLSVCLCDNVLHVNNKG